jgi:putative hydrolase of the HAD superfamily
MKISTVLLDAGGVILDESEDEKARVATAVEILRTVIPDYSADTLYSDLDEAIEIFCPRILAYALWKHLKPDRGLFEKLYETFKAEWRPRRPPLKLMPGIRSEIETIAGRLDIGIAGQYGHELIDLLRKESLLDYFAYRLTQDDFEITKPDPRYLEGITRACGIESEECIMVGDRIDNDIIPAKHLGMKTIRIRVGVHRSQGPRIPWEIPDRELDGVAGLAEAVFKVAGP